MVKNVCPVPSTNITTPLPINVSLAREEEITLNKLGFANALKICSGTNSLVSSVIFPNTLIIAAKNALVARTIKYMI